MTPPEYVEFLGDALGNATRVSRDGAVHFVCCDWRHVTEIMEAGRLAYCETLNIVVCVVVAADILESLIFNTVYLLRRSVFTL